MENPSSTILGPKVNFGFAFNNTDFSDRVLHIEIMTDSLVSNPDSDGYDSVHYRKRKRENLAKENDLESCTNVQVKTFHINSLLLAANSPFFHQLFQNGMKESHQRDVTLRINESEDAAFTEVLNFMYNNTLSSTTTLDLLGVLNVADKFEVTSCMKYCSELLQKMSTSLESALLYLELRSSNLANEVVEPLIDAAMQYLVARYMDIFKSPEEVIVLPLSALEVVLGSDDLKVNSEDEIFDFILAWARAHYPKSEERCIILTKRLMQLIRFPYMSSSKLKEALVCPDFDHQQVSKLVYEALFFKVEGRHIRANCNSKGRNYKFRPVKVVELKLSRPRCVVYYELKKEECVDLLLKRPLSSEQFCLGGQSFRLVTGCLKKEEWSLDYFRLFLFMEKGLATCTLDYEFAVMKNPTKEFITMDKAYNCTPKDRGTVTVAGDFRIPWIDFMAEDSKYFIDGIIHLRVQLTVNNSLA